MTDTNHIEVLRMVLDGRISGRISEWPQIKPAIEHVLAALSPRVTPEMITEQRRVLDQLEQINARPSARASAGESAFIDEWERRFGFLATQNGPRSIESIDEVACLLTDKPTPASPATGQVAAGCAHVWVPGQAGMMYCDQCGRQKPAATPQPAAAQHWSAASSFYKDDVVSEQDAKECFKGETLFAAPQPQEAPAQDAERKTLK